LVDRSNDIVEFHRKFNVSTMAEMTPAERLEATRFRIKFLLEEVCEYAEALGLEIVVGTTLSEPVAFSAQDVRVVEVEGAEQDLAKALDALVDLEYVCTGSAFMHGWCAKSPFGEDSVFDQAWRRVQAANMQKIRAKRPEDSKRGSVFDVVKPAGWRPPDLSDLVAFENILGEQEI
jgi:predicted HAD superfamily Cof-like phosphohydrolase